MKTLTKLEQLLSTSKKVGAVVSMDYDACIVASNDFYSSQVNGIPKRCFLLAVPDDESAGGVILLSVKQVQNLESTRSLQSLREELASNAVAADVTTRKSLQVIGYNCSIVGAFYEQDGVVKFGADVDRVLGFTSYSVMKPMGESLGFLASYSRNSFDNAAVLEVGHVRYSETELAPDKEAAVTIDVRDFIGKKTALLGMSRSGKSNTIKILVQQVFNYSMAQKQRIGQLVFDPQGEYANSNVQDKGALGALGTAHDVAIYKTTAVSDSGDREKPLLLNFFEEANAGLVWDLMLAEIHTGVSAGANYIAPLLTLSMTPPDRTAPIEEKLRYSRRRLGMYALMFLARMEGPIKNFYLTLPKDLVIEMQAKGELHEKGQVSGSNPQQLHITTLEAAYHVFDLLLQKYEEGELGNDSWIKSFKDGEMNIFKEQVEAFRSGRRGVTSAFMRLKELHSTTSSGDVREEVWKDLSKGKLVIVDLSRGSTSATRAISEMIVKALLGKASERFVNGQAMIPFQIVVEEAHNLFPRGGDDNDYTNPWVRVSKEAAKYEIGLMYATQEVSSVDSKILSNTSNWVISHLNSKSETAALAGYYSFMDWADHLRTTESKGFVRIKTESSPFIVPVQINLFTPREG